MTPKDTHVEMRLFWTSQPGLTSGSISIAQEILKRKSTALKKKGKEQLLPEAPWVSGDGISHRFSHVGVIFDIYQDVVVNGVEIEAGSYYFESWMKKDPITGHRGVRGPIPIGELIDWARAKNADGEQVHYCHETGRRLAIRRVPPWPGQAQHALDVAMSETGTTEYASVQLVHNLFFLLWGRGMPLKSKSPLKKTCCEFVAHLVADPIWKHSMLLGLKLCADETCPMWIWHGLNRAWHLHQHHVDVVTMECPRV